MADSYTECLLLAHPHLTDEAITWKAQTHFQALLEKHWELLSTDGQIRDLSDEEDCQDPLLLPMLHKAQVQELLRKNKMLTIVDALSLRNAETPSLTIDDKGHPSLFVGRGKDVNSS